MSAPDSSSGRLLTDDADWDRVKGAVVVAGFGTSVAEAAPVDLCTALR